MDSNARNGGKNATKLSSEPSIEVIYFIFILNFLFIYLFIT